MSTAIFSDWFHHTFVPIVRKKLRELGVEPKAVLVSDDQKIVAKFLPSNVTSLIQPMDQGVFESLKRRYRRKLLEKLLLRDGEGMSIIDFSKSIDMLQVANLISRCWDEITPLTLRHLWRKIFAESVISSKEGASTSEPVGNQEEKVLGSDLSTSEPAHDQEQQAMDTGSELEVDEFRCTFHRLGFDLSEAETIEWLNCDQQDRGYAHLTDEEILTVMNNKMMMSLMKNSKLLQELVMLKQKRCSISASSGCKSKKKRDSTTSVFSKNSLSLLLESISTC